MAQDRLVTEGLALWRSCVRRTGWQSRTLPAILGSVSHGATDGAPVIRPGTLAFDRFEIVREAGRGGMGAVYLARDRAREELVALKILLGDIEGTERFARESQTLASLGHPGIVRYVAHGPTWLAMEWLEGESLSERLRRGPIEVPEATRIAHAAALALGAGHAAGVVHRDIKPGNLFLASNAEGPPRVKVVDFGIARAVRPDVRSLTTTGTVLGTPYYMAPEQARGSREIGAAADVWSLGAVLYEMLSGHRPFDHESVMAVLAAVLLEEPTALAEHCPEAGEALTSLVMRCLDKRPENRPADGTALADALGALDLSDRPGNVRPGGQALTGREQRVVFLVLSVHAASGSDATVSDAGWSRSQAAASPEGALRAVADAHGARVESLGDGALLALVSDHGSPGDQAARAARLALAMHTEVPTAALVVGAGRAEVGLRLPVGDAVQRATELAEHARADPDSAVRVDPIAHGFLSGRFVLDGDAHGLRLLSAVPDGDSATIRRDVPLFGRDRELSTLESLAREVIDEPVARAALITGPPGIGKSRLLAELERKLRADGEHLVLALRGEPLRERSPHALAALVVRRAAEIEDGESLDVRRAKIAALVARTVAPPERPRTVAFLGEITRTPVDDDDPALRAARADAFLRGDLVEQAFSTWLTSLSRARPVALLVDDLQFVDEASITLLGKALERAEGTPLLVVMAGRPSENGAPILEEHEPTSVRLGKLTPKASRALMDAVAPSAEPQLAQRIVERSEGNPLFLEEMARAARHEGAQVSLPTSVLAVVEDRITELDPEGRRVLRALSILGARASEGELSTLLGAAHGQSSLADWLGLLERRDLVVRERSGEGPHRYSFRQPLVREAAYAMLTPADRALGHRLAAELAQAAPDADPAVVAAHFDAAGEGARAAPHYALAAERMLGAHDLKGALARAERGLVLASDTAVRAELHGTLARARRWRGEYDAAFTAASEALAGHAAGSMGWLDAASTLLSAASQRGRTAEITSLIEAVLALEPTGASERAALVVAACRAGSALLAKGDVTASERALARAEHLLASAPAEPVATAWCRVLRASLALVAGDASAFAQGTTLAVEAYEQAGDARDAVNQRVRLGNAWMSLGVPERAEPVLRAALADAERMGLRLVQGYAHQNLGHALAWLGRAEEASAELNRALEIAAALGDARLEAGARLYVAELLRGAGEPERAEREARLGRALVASVPGFGAVAAAHHALALLAVGDVVGAEAAAAVAQGALEASPEAFEEGEASIRRAQGEVLAARGEPEQAAAAAEAAWARITRRAAKIADVALRDTFLTRLPDHLAIAALRRRVSSP